MRGRTRRGRCLLRVVAGSIESKGRLAVQTPPSAWLLRVRIERRHVCGAVLAGIVLALVGCSRRRLFGFIIVYIVVGGPHQPVRETKTRRGVAPILMLTKHAHDLDLSAGRSIHAVVRPEHDERTPTALSNRSIRPLEIEAEF